MSDGWRKQARNIFPQTASLHDIKLRGTVEKKREGEHLCGGNFVYLATYPRAQGQQIRIFLRDRLGVQSMAAGRKEVERIYVNERNLCQTS